MSVIDKEPSILDFIAQNFKKGSPPFLDGTRELEAQYLYEHQWQFRHTFKVMRELGQSKAVLDIGPTPFTEFLATNLCAGEFYALDVTDHLGERLSRSGIELRCCDLDEEALPFADEAFDVLIFTEVLEHIFRKPREVLAEIYRVIEPGGTLYISVPNIAALHRRLQLLAGRSPLEDPDSKFRKGGNHGHGHLHEYTMDELLSKLREAGFEIVDRGWLRPSMHDCMNYKSRRAARVMYACVQHLWPSWGNVVWCRARRPC